METEEKGQPHLSLGSLIHLDLGLARRDTWFTAAWAAVCGAIASGGLGWRRETAVTLALALFLADPLLGGLCSALGRLPSPRVRSKSGSSNPGHPLQSPPRTMEEGWGGALADRSSLPLALPSPLPPPIIDGGREGRGLPLQGLRQAAHHALAWSVALVRPPVLPALIGLGAGLLAALTIALILGSGVMLIVALALGLVLLRFILLGRGSVESVWQRALLEVGAVWLLGFVALYDGTMFPPGGFYPIQAPGWRLWERYGWQPLAVAGLYAIAYGAWLALKGRRWLGAKLWLLNAAQVAVVGLLAAQRRPLLAALAVLLLLGQMLFQPWLRLGQAPLWYWRCTQFLLMASLLVASLGLANVWPGW